MTGCYRFTRSTASRCAVLTDRGSEYCGNPERQEYELYLAIEDIDHSRTKTKSPQTNGICERFHKTVLDEFYRIAFRKKLYHTIAELQADLDQWLRHDTEHDLRADGIAAGEYRLGLVVDEPQRTIDQDLRPHSVSMAVDDAVGI